MKKIVLIVFVCFIQLSLWSVYHKVGDFDTPNGASVESVVVTGNILYVASGAGLQILNVSNPQNPILLGTYEEIVRSVTVVGNIAYVSRCGLDILNVTNPQDPVLLGSFGIPDGTSSVAVSGNYAYLTTEYEGLKIINVANSQSPTLVGSYNTPGTAESVTVSGDRAYVCDGIYGLQIIDVSNPQNPTLLGSIINGNKYVHCSVVGNIAYVADSFSNNGLSIIDVSNPQNPIHICSYFTGKARSVNVIGNRAYVAARDNGLVVVDVSTPQNPVLEGSFDTLSSSYSIAVSGDIAFIGTTQRGIQIVNIANPQNSTVLGSYNSPGTWYSVVVENNIAYAARGGIEIINVTNPQNPYLLSSIESYGGIAKSIELVGDIAYCGVGTGLRIYNVSDPQNPMILGYCPTGGTSQLLDIVGNIAYVSDTNSGLKIIDVSDPHYPVIVGSYDTSWISDFGAVTVIGNYAYVIVSSCLLIINVSNPENPFSVLELFLPQLPRNICVCGNIAYVASDDGLLVINVADPQNPVILSSLVPHSTSYINTSLIHDGKLYVSDWGWNEIITYDISIPQTPVYISSYKWNLRSYSLFVENNKLYTANSYHGFCIHDLGSVDIDDHVIMVPDCSLLSVHPNPLGKSATIEYRLPQAEKVMLTIFNVKGQIIRELCSEFKQQGDYSLSWDGKDSSGKEVFSGIYLIKYSYGNHSEVKKVSRLH